MGLKGREIVERAGVDVETLIKVLNQAYCDEWLAYYQYWIGAKVAAGPQAHALVPEMEEHAREELEHAQQLAKRIIELGGTPVLTPNEWLKESTCGYLPPSDESAVEILKQNIQGERCAIEVYSRILTSLEGRDPITSHLLRGILADEVAHEEELESLFPRFAKRPKKSK